jgi:organic hydroperoxide reductase OsmC/OhrA
MEISATVKSAPPNHEAVVRTGTATRTLPIPPKSAGKGSAVNGGEFLMLALATCYCNDLYREAERLHIPLESVEVEASAQFPGVGLAAENIRYRAAVSSPAPAAAIANLLRQTDAIAEVHNTIRAGVPVALVTG